VADVFAVLADPTRRALLGLLRAHPRSVGELVEQVDIHQPGVSRHLRILHEAGLVQVEKDAQRRIYSVRPEPLQEIDAWLAQYRGMWEDRFDRFSAHLAKTKDPEGK